jgi:hypothetical protein
VSARDRARMRQSEEWQAPGAQAEWVAGGGAPKPVRQREERREWLRENLSEDLLSEAKEALRASLLKSSPLEDPEAERALEKISAGLRGIELLQDNPIKPKDRLPELETLIREGLELLRELGMRTRPRASLELSKRNENWGNPESLR